MDTIHYILDRYSSRERIHDPFIELPGLNRELFAHILAKLGLNNGVEVGVEAGIYSEILCKANPLLHLYCVDAWKAYSGYRDHTSQKIMDSLYEKAYIRLCNHSVDLIREFSMDAVKKFEDNSLDFVYIDGNHEFQHVVDDICQWTKKVRPGGIVAGHDFIKRKNNGYLMHVIPAVQGYCEAYDIKPLFVLGKKYDDGPRDRVRSWFFVKPLITPIVPGSGHKILS